MILKFTLGATVEYMLFDGSMYGSSGWIITEFAMGVAGGKEKTDHSPALSSALARVDLSVVTATDISQPSH